MENVKRLVLFAGILILVISSLISVHTLRANANAGNIETVETQEIKRALEKGYEAIHFAYQTNDPTNLSEIFVDTEDYKPSKKVKEDIAKIYGVEIAEKAGYLTAMETKYIIRGKVDKKMKDVLEKAKIENRKISKEEWQEIVEENGGYPPPSFTNTKDSNSKMELKYDKIEIKGDRAFVYYDNGLAYQKATLVKIDGKWFISNIEPINIHF